MSGHDLWWSYKNLSVSATTPTGSAASFSGISSNKYVMNGSKAADTAKQGLSKIQAAAAKNKISVDASTFNLVGVGKGAPWDMEEVLQAGLSSGAIADDFNAVQGFSSQYFGVDCTGFVSAYFRDRGFMTRRDAVMAGCHFFLKKARDTHNPLVWDLGDVQPDDVILWMLENGTETRKPGHIALVVDVSGNQIFCTESNGSPGPDPRHSTHIWGSVKGSKGARYVELNNPGSNPHVIVVRPFTT